MVERVSRFASLRAQAARDEIAVYSRLASLQHDHVRSWRRLTNVSVIAMENHSGGAVLRARPRTANPASARVGVLYETWHAYAANAMATVQAKGGTQLTVEQVVRAGSICLSVMQLHFVYWHQFAAWDQNYC